MSATIDPAKLKVVELRAELSKRGLDSKGNKPALVKRLKEALEEELKQEIPDTSIADTSTEDLDTSQIQEDPAVEEESKVPDKPEPQEKMETEEAPASKEEKPEETESKEETPEIDKEEPQDTAKEPEVTESKEEVLETNKENGEQEASKPDDSNDVQEKIENESESNKEIDVEPKGEKRRRSSVSPDRSQRRRSKSPIKEDEPPIDTDKVQLSWYDSDLHLQVDKESFLSAKPYHEGAFGFAWAGVRATHGVNSGKVCFEVKISEELKWEDFSKYYDKHRRDHKSSSKHKDDDRKKEEKEPKSKDEIKTEEPENGDKTEENDAEMKEPEEKMDAEEIKEEAKETEEKQKETEEIKDENEEKKEETEEKKDENEEKKDENEEKKEESEEKKEETEEKKEPEPVEILPTHLFRVGWSLLRSGLQLGEDEFSYGYESSGRFVVNKEFHNYGQEFGVGDVIASFLNIDEENLKISYSVNGVAQPEAVSIPISDLPENFVLFPHVLSRNYAFELNLGSLEESWFATPENFQFLEKVESKIAGPVRPENRSDCEVILMCGLPASGKTHWVREYIKENPEKKYTVLGNSHLLEKMTVSGDALKSKYKGSWNVLLEKLQKCLNKLVEIASLRRRNYIIDQPNVYPSAQRRKLRPFEGFKRRAVVVVVGDEEQAKRQSLQEAEGGKDVPDSTVLDMKANMSLPQKNEWIDEVVYAEANEEEAKTIVQKYNSSARETIGIQRRFGHGDRDRRWQNRRNDYRGNYRDRNYHNNRYDRGPPRQGNWHQMRPGGWNRDRRDNRGPPMGGSRDWRNRGGNSRDRGNRDSHSQQTSSYNRNRNQPRGPGGNWPANWSQSQSSWGNQPYSQGSWNQNNWSSSSNQNQWKYGGGSQNYGGYSNWNYYGQYPQNWGSQQGQTHSTSSAASTNQYGQYSQQDWAQYAQQYAQQGQTTATSQSTPQK